MECKHGIEESTCDYCSGKVAQERRELPDASYDYGRCRSPKCRQTIMWVRMEPRNSMTPLDPEPTATGNVRLIGGGKARVMKQREVEDDTTGDRYVTHFVTCPAVADFKRSGR